MFHTPEERTLTPSTRVPLGTFAHLPAEQRVYEMVEYVIQQVRERWELCLLSLVVAGLALATLTMGTPEGWPSAVVVVSLLGGPAVLFFVLGFLSGSNWRVVRPRMRWYVVSWCVGIALPAVAEPFEVGTEVLGPTFLGVLTIGAWTELLLCVVEVVEVFLHQRSER